MKLTELFSGIGSPTQALKNAEVCHERKISEIDKFAIKSYNAIHGETENLGSVCDIRSLDGEDLVTYGFPCQDISLSGKQEGLSKGSGTRSGLLWEVERILENTKNKPKFLLLENVKNLVGKKFKPDFDKWLEKLEEMGYVNYWQVLNAKDYGIPQNRERVFVLSIRKDVDKGFEFPEKQELKLRLKDMLEDEVDEKFYLKQEIVDKLIINSSKKHLLGDSVVCEQRSDEGLRFFKDNVCGTIRTINSGGDKRVIVAQRGRYNEDGNTEQRLEINKKGISNTITTVQKDNYVIEPKIDMIGLLDIKGNEQVRRCYGGNGISPTLNTMQGGNRQPKVLIKNATKKGYLEAEEGDGVSLEFPNSKTRRGGVQKGLSPTLQCNDGKGTITEDLRIRKLTPLECWRLMGFSDGSFHSAEKVCSASQLYKQAGNSIVVDVLEGIFKQMVKFGYLDASNETL